MKLTKCLLLNTKNLRVLTSLVGLIAILLSNTIIVRPQNSNTSTNLRGLTREVLVIPGSTTNAGELNFVSDRDNDGMSDGDELANGTNPDDPADADGDLDGDGLTNGDEVAKGTNPNATDSDGDGVSDAEEIRLGYNPNDSTNSPPPNTSIVSISVAPSTITLVMNQIFGQEPKQLTVTGTTNFGATVDLTANLQTVYQSIAPSVAVVNSSGLVAAAAVGSTIIEVRNGSLTARASVLVSAFTPASSSALQIPGYANSVAANGNYAYVASGSAGLQIVNIGSGTSPQISASLDTPGNANDVKISGNRAYIADGSAGLAIININNPSAPFLEGFVDTPGSANDVAVDGNFAYVADGLSGLQIIDVSNPSSPVIAGSVDTPGTAVGIGVSTGYAVIADANPSIGIRVINISNRAAPQITGNLTMSFEPADVTVRDNLAFVAGRSNGVNIVNFANPAAPVVVGVYPGSTFSPFDIALQDDFAFAAEILRPNFVPVFNISDPQSVNFRGGIDFSNLGSAKGTGIAVNEEFVYLTGDVSGTVTMFGTAGNTKLFIGRYQSPTDSNGIAPTVALTSPADGATCREGDFVNLSATASDDVQVAGVEFKANGLVVGSDSTAPYEFVYRVPINTTSLAITASAYDLAGNTSSTAPVTIFVTPDPPPTVEITSPSEGTTLVGGQVIQLSATASDNQSVAQVKFSANGVEAGVDTTAPYNLTFTVPTGIDLLELTATVTDNVGHTTSATRNLTVVPDPGTIVTGRVVDEFFQPIENAAVTIQGPLTVQSAADGTFSIPNAPTWQGFIQARATALINNRKLVGTSASFTPVIEGTTYLGDIILKPLGKVVFQSNRDGNSEIYVMDGDGANQTRLTTNTLTDFAPYFSPDGSKILYTQRDFCGGFLIRVMDSDGNNQVNLGSWINYNVYDATAWSADSEKLVLGALDGLYVINADGTNRRRLAAVNSDYASWARDAGKIAFLNYSASSRGEVFSINPDGTNLVRLTNAPTLSKYYIVASPDGSKVAFVQDDGGTRNENIYVVNADGTNRRKITNFTGSRYWQPAWSPDSTRVTAIRNDANSLETVVVLDADNAASPVEINSTSGDSPTWSPDGTQLLYAENGKLYRANADGTNVQLVSSTNDWTPHWSPVKQAVSDPGTTITGRIVDETNQPVSGAKVLLFDQHVATTDADGNYSATGSSTLKGGLRITATATVGGKTKSGFAATPTEPVAGGTTFLGDVRIAEKMVFISNRDGRSEVYVMDANGANQQRLTNFSNTKHDPALSPDGTKISFMATDSSGDFVYIMNLDGSGQTTVQFEGGRCSGATTRHAVWSPDNSKLLLTVTRTNNTDIYTVNKNGSNLVRLTTHTAVDTMPSWSPDGSQIVFVSTRDGNNEIYTMRADGSLQTRVTSTITNENEPAWSPDGSRILFESLRSGFTSLFTINVNGSNEIQLTSGFNANFGSWSSDGSRIAFSSNVTGGVNQIYTINQDGTNRTQLTTSSGGNTNADW
ncbi:MAG TPA: Ig-like domain-containing protein [Pyrinomonadaceae bacterium]|jgi:Tol biopolymer transport system component